jgi:3-hydroxyacyl-CoA dehydrogenase
MQKEKRIMPVNKPVRRIAIVGTGVIGASWSAQYLARGFDVITTDGSEAENVNHLIDQCVTRTFAESFARGGAL